MATTSGRSRPASGRRRRRKHASVAEPGQAGVRRPGATPIPGAGRAASLLFGALARLRGDRALHPDGVVFAGTFRALGSGAAAGTDLFEGEVEKSALVRISRGAGAPEPLPDILGCAVRVVDAYGRGAHQDFALASSRRAPIGRHALLPARDFLGAFYSSILPYRLGSHVALIGAELESVTGSSRTRLDELRAGLASDLSVRLLVAAPLGPWHAVASVRLERVATDAEARRLRFNPWNSGAGIRPIGVLNGLRDPAYRGSQAAFSG